MFLDRYFLLLLHARATPQLDQIMLFLSLLGSRVWVVPFDGAVFLVLAALRRWRDALFWGLAVGGAGLLNAGAKHTLERARPDLWQSIAPETTYSFPSAHAMQTMALAAALLVLAWPTRWRWPTLMVGGSFVLLIGLSRVYLGVHYPSDVLAGWATSIAWVLGLSIVFHGQLTRPARHPVTR